MRRLLYLGVASILVLALSGCGGDSRSDFVAEIFSDQQADGDIAFNRVSNSFTVTNGPDTILFGIDESNADLPEFRAFLDFPLDGSTNQDVVPAGAEILSATLEVFVNEVSFAGTVPTLMDLVPFSVNGLTPADFDSPPLQFPDGTNATLSFDFIASDQGNFVRIDVTSLMQETQRRGLFDFQVRFLLDFVPNAIGFVGIEDLPNVTMTAPLLSVRFR